MRVGVWVLTWQLPSSPEKAPRTPCCLGGHLFCSLASGILETHSLNPVSWLMGQDLLEFTWERKPRPPERHRRLGCRGDGAKPPPWEAGGSSWAEVWAKVPPPVLLLAQTCPSRGGERCR